MTEPVAISHSDISAFLRCRRQWAWGFIADYKKPERPVGAAVLGSRVHSGLEAWTRDPTVDPIAVHDEIARRDIAQLETEGAPAWEIDNLYNEMILGRNAIQCYLDWQAETGVDAEYEVIGVEQKLQALILGGRVLLIGKADRLLRSLNDSMVYVDDWKTTGAQGSVREMFERSYQAPVYMALAAMQPDHPTIGGAFYTVIRKSKNPARATRPLVERFRVPATRRTAETKLAQIERICSDMLELMAKYQAGDEVAAYPTPMESCRWCDLRQPCELQDENPAAAAAMLGAEFQHGGKHARYGVD